MKLIIDIPEEIYKASQIIDVKYEDVIQIPLEVIKNGALLPKNHGRMIDNEEVIAILKTAVFPEDYTVEEVQQALDKAIQALEQTKWIPVSEKLPNFNDVVLASVDDDIFVLMYLEEEFWFNGGITAWMPLPKPHPYKESEESLWALLDEDICHGCKYGKNKTVLRCRECTEPFFKNFEPIKKEE